MKTRIGFVSNSSSSSFVFIGRKIDVSEAETLIKNGNVIADTGMQGGDGDIIMENITPDIFEVLKQAANGKWGEQAIPTFYEVFAASGSDSYSIEFNPTNLPPITLTIYDMNVDYHNPGSAVELEERYGYNYER